MEKQCHQPPMTENGNHATYKNGDDSGMVYGILWHCLPTLVEVWLWSIQVVGKLVILTSHKFAGTVANPTMSLPFQECAKTTCFSLGKWETVYYWAARCCKHLTCTSNETGDAVDKSTSIWSPTATSRWKGLGLFQFRYPKNQWLFMNNYSWWIIIFL